MSNLQSPKINIDTDFERLEHWLNSCLGQALLKKQQAFLDEKLSCLFGFHLMQLSISRNVRFYDGSAIKHKFALSPLPEAHQEVAAFSELDSLPIETESVDVALLHHVLEFSNNPHQLLREASRAIVPSGHILIVGYNPWSLVGCWSKLAGYRRNSIWQNHLLSARRLVDWLTLLDFTVNDVNYLFFAPPVNSPGTLSRCEHLERGGRRWNLPVGGCYVIHAIKEVVTATPIRPFWHKREKSIVNIPFVKPTTHKTPIH